MTTATKITLVRVILIPFFMFFLIESGKAEAAASMRWIALAIFIIASLSDFVDGQVARRCNQVTNFGKFLDPLADKLLVVSCMIIFISQSRLPDWLVFVVIAREFAISGLRMVAASNGTVIAAGWSGKLKTFCTMVGLCVMMAFPGVYALDFAVGLVILVTTVYSGVEYFCKNAHVLRTQA